MRTLQREVLLWFKLTRFWSFSTLCFWKCCLGSVPLHHCQRIKKKKGFVFIQYLPPSGILLHPPVCVPIRSHFYLSLEPCGENTVCFSYRLKCGYFLFNFSNDDAATKENKRRCNYRMKQLSIFLYLAPSSCAGGSFFPPFCPQPPQNCELSVCEIRFALLFFCEGVSVFTAL